MLILRKLNFTACTYIKVIGRKIPRESRDNFIIFLQRMMEMCLTENVIIIDTTKVIIYRYKGHRFNTLALRRFLWGWVCAKVRIYGA